VARNIEIKARAPELSAIAKRAALLSQSGPTEIFQDDTFFKCPNGRLKLRTFSSTNGQLIFYQRSDVAGPKESFYVLSQTQEPDTMRDALTHAYGQVGRVIKNRTLYLIGQTRVHLDQVNDLGDFVELEVVLADGQTAEHGVAIANEVMAQLGIDSSQWVTGAYLDLLCA
jgi:predicted adenylyl cyclase CyaB